MNRQEKRACWIAGVASAVLAFAFSMVATAADTRDAALALTPPMGWNSWNHFAEGVTDADIRHAADAMVSSGMAAAGYRYIIIDDGWQGQRDAQGVLHANAKFPDMKALADYVHSKGLKFGIYSSPGEKTCAGYTGSFGHEMQDARTFASWGVDYLKYDLCSFHKHMEGKSEAEQTAMMQDAYRTMRRALDATHRLIVYALCNYGWGRTWTWGADVGGNLWRTTDDIRPDFESVMFNATAQLGLEKYAGPGHWNDADMLEIGNKGLDSPDMQRTHMSLWAILAAPLIAGNDLSQMSDDTRAVLTNREVLAVNQDSKGIQGRRVAQEGPMQIWMRPLADGSMAVGLVNTMNHALLETLDLQSLGWHGPANARDLWKHQELGRIDGKKTFEVPAYGTVLLKVSALQR
jgi:alpha-galactosidase